MFSRQWKRPSVVVILSFLGLMLMVSCSSNNSDMKKENARRDCESAGNAPNVCRNWIGL